MAEYLDAWTAWTNLGKKAAYCLWNNAENAILWQHIRETQPHSLVEGVLKVLKIDGKTVVDLEEYEKHLQEIAR